MMATKEVMTTTIRIQVMTMTMRRKATTTVIQMKLTTKTMLATAVVLKMLTTSTTGMRMTKRTTPETAMRTKKVIHSLAISIIKISTAQMTRTIAIQPIAT